MTREQWAKLTPEEQRIKIAELCDIHSIRHTEADGMERRLGYDLVGYKGTQRAFTSVPDYLNDLNAMHEAENTMKGDVWHEYAAKLKEVSQYRWHATATQRAEAFVLTMEEAGKYRIEVSN